MANLDRLAARSLRAYELGRLRVAVRVLLVIAPVAAMCLIESQGRETCACLIVILAAAAIWLRWRDRNGARLVRAGLWAGSVPLAVGLVLPLLPSTLSQNGPVCTTISIVAGAVAGVIIVHFDEGGAGQRVRWWGAVLVAGLAASAGWLRIGVLGVAIMIAAIAVGAFLSSLSVSHAT